MRAGRPFLKNSPTAGELLFKFGTFSLSPQVKLGDPKRRRLIIPSSREDESALLTSSLELMRAAIQWPQNVPKFTIKDKNYYNLILY